eukprot:TRINITY_DN3819_c2_g1_i2.p1 TRINITY_DN3819_c2_g1~~TRINITY_DN3819_c2_g1_i2.p1  ORF type:complete len:272 (-),score=39.79 TRINITY_DN3819_c2_g1_i2:725-1540(-)
MGTTGSKGGTIGEEGIGNGSRAGTHSAQGSRDDLNGVESPPYDNELQEALKNYDYHEQLIHNVLVGDKDRTHGLGQLNALPDECILRVFSFLPIEDICGLSCVSKTLFTLGRDDALWRNLYRVRGVRSLFGPGAHELEIDDDWHKKIKRQKKRKPALSPAQVKANKKNDGPAPHVPGKWRNICLKNMLLLPEGEPLILNEQILGCPLERVEELFGQCDEVTTVGRGDAYYFFHAVGLSMCCEDSKITSVLKHAPLDSCTGPAYEKIVPLPF